MGVWTQKMEIRDTKGPVRVSETYFLAATRLEESEALARFVAAAVRYGKSGHTHDSVNKVVQVTPSPATEKEVTDTALGQIYRDIDDAWLSGIAHRRLGAVLQVIDLAALWFEEENLQDRTPIASGSPSRMASKGSQLKTVSFQDEVSSRYATVASAHGWMMLSMLAYSKSFRQACRDLDETPWAQLMQSISQNYVSLELCFKVRGLDWITPLRRLEKCFSADLVASYINHQAPRALPASMLEKPHSYVVPNEDGNLLRPSYRGVLHLNISSSTYDAQVFKQDPSLRSPYSCICYSCGQPSCDCDTSTSEKVARPLVELIHCSAQKGIGVRSLQRVEEGAVLDEYVGELKHANSVEDPTYALELAYPWADRMQMDNPILIDSSVRGNWTRYINASCSPSLKFVPAVIGKRYRMMVVANRDIDVFEELTIDYGDGYWLQSDTRMCKCNEPDCRYADMDSKQRIRETICGQTDCMDLDEDDEEMKEADVLDARLGDKTIYNHDYLREYQIRDLFVENPSFRVISVEDHRPGYPWLLALISSHSSLDLCRHFGRLRARLLLLKQDKLSDLERQTGKIDAGETHDLFRGNGRNDGNAR
ncbi:MAG: hypothetical protein LQ345_003035 [Seirophora villosa]|nr:MAG: hypothetical protein LQ345_003035 [Seirophora villosa]